MFIEVKRTELIVGEKYKIKIRGDEYTGIFKHRIHLNVLYNSFDNVIHIHTLMNYGSGDMCSTQSRNIYYKFVSQKEQIQQAMEQRALDIVLKRLVNNDFMW
jgi:hypothetical protein